MRSKFSSTFSLYCCSRGDNRTEVKSEKNLVKKYARIDLGWNFQPNYYHMAVNSTVDLPRVNKKILSEVDDLNELELFVVQDAIKKKLKTKRGLAVKSHQRKHTFKMGNTVRCIGFKNTPTINTIKNIEGRFTAWSHSYATITVQEGSNTYSYNGFPTTMKLCTTSPLTSTPTPEPAIPLPLNPNKTSEPMMIRQLPIISPDPHVKLQPTPPQYYSYGGPTPACHDGPTPLPTTTAEALLFPENDAENKRRRTLGLAPIPRKTTSEVNGKIVVTQQTKEVDVETGIITRTDLVKTTTFEMVDLTN